MYLYNIYIYIQEHVKPELFHWGSTIEVSDDDYRGSAIRCLNAIELLMVYTSSRSVLPNFEQQLSQMHSYGPKYQLWGDFQ